MELERKISIMEGFTETFKKYSGKDIIAREVDCLNAQYPAIFCAPKKGDLLAGWVEILPIGFFPQEGGLGYYLNSDMMQTLYDADLSGSQRERLHMLENFWKCKNTAFKVREAYPDWLAKLFPSDDWLQEPGIGFPLYRMSGSQLDFDKLIRLGLQGLREEVARQGVVQSGFYKGLLSVIDLVEHSCVYYQKLLLALSEKEADSIEKQRLQKMASVFERISRHPPANLHEAAQLVMLYTLMSGSFNFGRMDEYFGDIYVNDLDNGISEEEELDILVSFWKIINRRKTIFDGRVIIGGKGRRNRENADAFAKLAMKTSLKVNDVLPQLTLRFYEGQNTDLLEMALDNIGNGCTFPLLYNDDVNIPSVASAFNISIEEAENYVPFGCGEYTIYKNSFGTPSGVIDLLKALEMAIHDGIDPNDGQRRGLTTGRFADFADFEAFFVAYKKQVEDVAAGLAYQEKLEYDVCAQESPFLLFSLLYDDCIKNNKPIFEGGIRYLGGTLETYGNTNAADSLMAIKKLVFDEKRIPQASLPMILKANFKGFSIEKALMEKVVKYGNDDAEADAMLLRVHNHICNFTREQASKVGLHHYLVVIINNHANTILGRKTHASADGRVAFCSMANANAPSSGKDKNGLTSMLNSIVKPPTNIHAGSVQNIKFSRELFNQHRDVMKALLDTYFDGGGSQAMITVLGKDDLKNAMKNPENYQNLMVRVGGFSARFVELDRDVQEEILDRTLY